MAGDAAGLDVAAGLSEAFYGEGRAPDDPRTVRRVAAAAGLDGDALVERWSAPEAFADTMAMFDAERRRGVTSYPTVFLEDEVGSLHEVFGGCLPPGRGHRRGVGRAGEDMTRATTTRMEETMGATETPICDFGWKAPDFRLPAATDGREIALDEIAGERGTLVMFLANHCPYVKAVLDRIIRDAQDLKALGIGVVAISSNDAETYPADGPMAMKRIAEGGAAFSLPPTSTTWRDQGGGARLRGGVHARLLRLRPRAAGCSIAAGSTRSRNQGRRRPDFLRPEPPSSRPLSRWPTRAGGAREADPLDSAARSSGRPGDAASFRRILAGRFRRPGRSRKRRDRAQANGALG